MYDRFNYLRYLVTLDSVIYYLSTFLYNIIGKYLQCKHN